MTAITPVQVAALITEPDITPPLSLIVQRTRAGRPIPDLAVQDVRDGIAALKAAIRRAENEMEGTP